MPDNQFLFFFFFPNKIKETNISFGQIGHFIYTSRLGLLLLYGRDEPRSGKPSSCPLKRRLRLNSRFAVYFFFGK